MEAAQVSFSIPSLDLFLLDDDLIDRVADRTSRTASVFTVGMNRPTGK